MRSVPYGSVYPDARRKLTFTGGALDLTRRWAPKSNGRIRVDLRLHEAATGDTIAEVAITGSETELFDLVSRAGVQLRGKSGVEAVSADKPLVFALLRRRIQKQRGSMRSALPN